MSVSLVGLLSLLALTGCSEETTEEWKRLGLPEGITDRTPYVEDLWVNSWIAALLIGGLTWTLIVWAAVRYRRRSDDEDPPAQVRYNLPIEVLYTIAPVIVVAVLFFFTVETQDKLLNEVDTPEHEVIVTAQQWSWTFNYRGEPAVGGEDVHDLGTPADLPELWLVEDETVRFTLHSPDVIHSFWVPSFLFKLDVIPGRDQAFSLTPTQSGTFVGRCAELCGWQHTRMLFNVVVTDRATFDEHMRELQDAGQTGALLGGRDAERVSGINEPEAGGE